MGQKRVALESLGCKLNYAETIQIEKEFKKRGFDVVDSSGLADVVVINTCTVTRSADSDCRQVVRRALRNSPQAYVVVTGCYAQGKPEEVAQIEGVNLVLGAQEKFHLFEYVDDFSKPEGNPDSNYHARILAGPIQEAIEFGAADSATEGSRTRAFLKVQDGCNFNCSYCTIPKVRGTSRNPSIELLVDEANQIAASGFKELVLSGVNVGDFEIGGRNALIDLLKALEKVDGIDRIRISSVEPNLLTKEVIHFIAYSEKFCNHFHVPLQSGSDDVLRRMRRRYNTEQYHEVVNYIRDVSPDAGIGADVIVGFPGETNEAFERSYGFVERLALTYLHVFTYSERDGTPAASFQNRIDPRVKRKRSELLRMLSSRKRYEFNRKQVGKIVKVLVEDEMKKGKVYGFTPNYVRVELEAGSTRVNEVADVSITGVSDNTVVGQVI